MCAVPGNKNNAGSTTGVLPSCPGAGSGCNIFSRVYDLHKTQVIVIKILIIHKIPIPRGRDGTRRSNTMNLKNVVGKTCVWCGLAIMAALSLLAITWTVILVGNQ